MTLILILLAALIGVAVYGVWLAGELGVGPGVFRSRQTQTASDKHAAEGIGAGDTVSRNTYD